MNVLIPHNLNERVITKRAYLQIQIGAVHDPSLPSSSSRPASARCRPISRQFSNLSSIEKIPTIPPSNQEGAGRFDSPEEEKVIEIVDDDYEPPEPIYQPEPKEEEPRRPNVTATNIFTDSVSNGSPSDRSREVQGGVQCVSPFSRRTGFS